MKVFLIVALLMASGASCDKPPPVEDPPVGVHAVTVTGCPGGSGALGIETLSGAVGDTVTVAITTQVLDRVNAWLVDLAYPVGYLTFVEATEGSLLGEDWEFISASKFARGVRVGGYGGHGAVEAGASGSLCDLTFVIEPGEGFPVPHETQFAFLNVHDDLKDYGRNCSGGPLIPTAAIFPQGRMDGDMAIVDLYLKCDEGGHARCLGIDMAYGNMEVVTDGCILSPTFDDWSGFSWNQHPIQNVLRVGGFTTGAGVPMNGAPLWIGSFVFTCASEDVWAEIERTEICLEGPMAQYPHDRIATGERWEK